MSPSKGITVVIFTTFALLLHFPLVQPSHVTINSHQDLSESLTYADIHTLQNSLPPQVLLGENFDSGDPTCNLHILSYLGGIISFKGWALQMLDSTAILFGGILKANHEFLGNYDECLEVVSPKNFTGQHCLLQGVLNGTFPGIPASQKLIFNYGMCLPSTCSAEQITKGVSWISKVTKGLVSLEATDEYCNIDEAPVPTTGDAVAMAFLCLIAAIACISTLYDVHQQFIKDNKKPHPLLASFSLYTNGKSLFVITQGGDGQMENINGLRVLSMIWIVFFHCFSMVAGSPILNIIEAFTAPKERLYSFLINAFLAVDTFLLISGLLVAKSFFSAMARQKTFDVPSSYIHRYIRITPPYAMVLLFQVTIFQYLGDGPIWPMASTSQIEPCKEYWWTGLLFVQNLVNPDNLCMVQTWYLSADMQLYWLSPLLLYPMYKWPKIAPGLLTLVTLAFTFLPFALAYTNGFAPIALWDTTGKQNSLDNYPTYSRAAPWLVGLALGYLMSQLKSRKIKVNLNARTVIVAWVIAFAVGAACIFGVIAFIDTTDFSDSPGSAFYLAFHRLGWALAISWLIFACTYGYGGIINHFLSWGAFQPLGKLSFGVYLVHIQVLLYKVGIGRTNTYFNLPETLFIFLAVYSISHVVALLLHLLVELPFMNLDKHFLRKVKILPLPPKKKPPLKTEVKEAEA